MASEETNTPTADDGTPGRRGITVRRAPKYVPFLIVGGLVGVAMAAVVAFALPVADGYDPSSIFGFFMVTFGAGGVLLGAVVALLLDWRSVKRARHAVVEALPAAAENESDGGSSAERQP